jgi:hypothetical protein
MITKNDLNFLYNWSKNKEFPLKIPITSHDYSNKPIKYCWLKNTMKYSLIREKIIDDKNVFDILKNSEILFVGFMVFDSNTKLEPHKDPNIYSEPYKRIQIPLEIPDKDLCYMIWRHKKVYWTEGECQVYDVMDYIHEGHNYSNKPMKFLFVDVKKNVIVES